MEKNKELIEAWEFVEHTGTSVFLTGKAGTGKTTFLKTVKEHSSKRMIVVAPTGVAAINAGGVTIHSFFQLPPTLYIPGTTIRDRYDFSKSKRRIIASLDMVVIDEISMVRADLLDAIDFVLRRYRDATQPFGGVQLVMIGDLQQLTPVVTREEEALLGQYYDTPYFFGSKALQQISYVTIQLTHVFRQQDERFISILNHVRDGHPTAADLNELNARCKPTFIPRDEEGYIRLTTHNRQADSYNDNRLLKLPGKRYAFTATVKGDFPPTSYPAEQTLQLKVGAQVMFLKNDSSGQHLYYNGRIGHVTAINGNEILVRCPGDAQPIKVEPEVWENTRYVIDPSTKSIQPKVEGTFAQYPLRLAWAITIHKSQGLTFEHAIIDAALSFASGQVYVALSRCKSLEGLVLASPITAAGIINDPRVSDYIAHQQQAAEESIRQLPSLKQAYYRQQLYDLFNFGPLFAAGQLLQRTLVEHFRLYDRLTLFFGQSMDKMKQDVMDVAYRWQGVMRGMDDEALHGEPFLLRVRRSADYFAAKLKELVRPLLDRTKMVKQGSQQAMQLLDERYKAFLLQYMSKVKVLDVMADEAFTVAGYMQAKQEQLLDALDAVDPTTEHRRRTRKSRKAVIANPYEEDEAEAVSRLKSLRKNAAATGGAGQPAKPQTAAGPAPAAAPPTQKEKGKAKKEAATQPPKPSTYDQTLALFRQGQTPEQIATARGLALSTIYSHLARFTHSGEVVLDKVLPAAKIRAIRQAMAQLPEDATGDAVRSVCPEGITPAEFYFVLRTDRGWPQRKKEKTDPKGPATAD